MNSVLHVYDSVEMWRNNAEEHLNVNMDQVNDFTTIFNMNANLLQALPR